MRNIVGREQINVPEQIAMYLEVVLRVEGKEV